MPRYVELHCRTNFSFLEGASHADELVERAARLGYEGLAVTDRDTLAGIVRAHGAAKDRGLRLVVGAELTLGDAQEAEGSLAVWPQDRAAYARLCRLLTLGRRRAGKGRCELRWHDFAEHAEGMLAGLIPHASWDEAGWERGLGRLRDLLGDRAYLLAHAHGGVDDRGRLAWLGAIARRTGVPLLAAGDVRYHAPARQPLHDVLTAVRLGATVDQIRGRLPPNSEWHLRPLERIAEWFAAAPDAVERTCEVAARCPFSLDELRYEYPLELAPAGEAPADYLERLAWRGAERRYPEGVPEKVRGLLRHELALIRELHYEAYFLTVFDLVRHARRQGILCQGRGSAANSAVCYCLGVTSVDPERSDVLFERFLSRERNEAPDIDVDFEHERREEVLQYLYAKYGRERAGMTAAVITYRARSAVRDVGKALGLSPDRIDVLAKNLDGSGESPLVERCRQAGIDPDSEQGRRLVHLTRELIGFPRHLSQHVGGMVITRGPLCELAPIENAAMPGRTVVQWDKDDLDELGILKVDCLSLGMLTAIRKCFALVESTTGRKLSLATVPAEDPAVYDMVCRADTLGVFQIESRAQMSMLPRLRPRCFYDLVIEVAIVRPGPIQGQMVHPYLRRRAGLEVPEYPSEAIREVLHKTLGVPLFQEQAMRLAVVAAGFTPGEADQLRRAMGAWRRPGVIDRFHQQLIEGMRARGLDEQFAEQVFQQIRGFGEYGFPESHAASFALLVYVSAWLKRYHPAAFAAAILNSQPMGFYAPAQLVRDAREHGVEVRPIDVTISDWDCTLEPPPGPHPTRPRAGSLAPADTGSDREHAPDRDGAGPAPATRRATGRGGPALRLGLRLVGGLARGDVERLVEARRAGSFRSLGELARRAGLGRGTLERLARADAFAGLGRGRREALWDALGAPGGTPTPSLFDEGDDEPAPPDALPKLTELEQVFADYRAAGLSLRGHPLSFFREGLERLRAVRSAELVRRRHGESLVVAGLVLLRQRPSTARGITFVTLEDETGVANLVVRQDVWERFGMVCRHAPAWLAHGRLERQGAVIHLLVRRVEDLSAELRRLEIRSRDFR